MSFVGDKLDRFCHLDKQLSTVSVKCTVSIPSNCFTNVVPISLGFFSNRQSKQCKFDILLSLDADKLEYSQFVLFYGTIVESDLKDSICLALNDKFYPIKKLVSCIVDIIESH